MAFTVIIPARFASTRLPGKPLAEIDGEPMIRHVCRRAAESKASRVVVATDDESIRVRCELEGIEVLMTAPDHASGTDRLQEVARKLALADDHIVVNVQGDEPLMPPALINQVADNLEAMPDASIATLCEPIHDPEQVFNPNAVKVVSDEQGRALYFSRAPIPWARDHFQPNAIPGSMPSEASYFRHIGLYAYRVELLHKFVSWPPAPLENAESLEQLRALWNGARIHVAQAQETPPAGVDTPEDLARVRDTLAGVGSNT